MSKHFKVPQKQVAKILIQSETQGDAHQFQCKCEVLILQEQQIEKGTTSIIANCFNNVSEAGDIGTQRFTLCPLHLNFMEYQLIFFHRKHVFLLTHS